MAEEKSKEIHSLVRLYTRWGNLIEIERILEAYHRFREEDEHPFELTALVDGWDFRHTYQEIQRDRETVVAVLETAVRDTYALQKYEESRASYIRPEEGIKTELKEMLQDFYLELDAAVATGVYEEIQFQADSLLGMAELTLRPDPDCHDLLEEAVERVERAYRTYAQTAEQKERDQGHLELAEMYLGNIGAAEEQADILGTIVRHLRSKRAVSE